MSYRTTRNACYLAIFTQAIQNNLPPLLFIVFQEKFGISFEMLGRLILLNFATQLIVDLLSIRYADKIGYRTCMIAGQSFVALGLVGMCVLPQVLPNPYVGLAASVMVAAIGGGLTEVLVSPIVEAVPGDEKAAAMSMLHSFYCWGQVATVLGTTLLLQAIGHDNWRLIPLAWIFVPIASAVLYTKAPMPQQPHEAETMRLGGMLKNHIFIAAMVVMVCAGASELTMSQWSSLFAEKGLRVTKVIGDLAGPCLFGVLMGLGRMLYGIWGSRLPLRKCLIGCAVLCIVCYLTAALSASPAVALAGCALCGLSVSLMWPGSLSRTAKLFPTGGTAMFALLAMMGDTGCSLGPWMAGAISDAVEKLPFAAHKAAELGLTMDQISLKAGLLFGVIFPVILLIGTMKMKDEGDAA